MVITTVEGAVEVARERDLLEAWARATAEGALPPGFVESFLVRSMEGTTWRVITVWESMEALQAMRAAAGTPPAIAMFRAGGVEPALSIWDVREHASP